MRASERLTIAVTLSLCTLTGILRPDGGAARFVVFLLLAMATAWLATRNSGPVIRFLRDWVPVVALVTIFLLLQPIIEAAVPWRLDTTLAAFDARHLASLVSAWRGALGRPSAFTDFVYIAYVSYYFLPITVAAIAWGRGPEVFEKTVYPVILTFYLTFLGYILFPATGPRLPMEAEASELGGGAVSNAVRAFLHTAEATTLDAFPSGHTAIAIVSAVLGAGLVGPAAAVALAVWALSIIFATVYINVHYAVDVLAAVPLAVLVLVFSSRRRSSHGGAARPSR